MSEKQMAATKRLIRNTCINKAGVTPGDYKSNNCLFPLGFIKKIYIQLFLNFFFRKSRCDA